VAASGGGALALATVRVAFAAVPGCETGVTIPTVYTDACASVTYVILPAAILVCPATLLVAHAIVWQQQPWLLTLKEILP